MRTNENRDGDLRAKSPEFTEDFARQQHFQRLRGTSADPPVLPPGRRVRCESRVSPRCLGWTVIYENDGKEARECTKCWVSDLPDSEVG